MCDPAKLSEGCGYSSSAKKAKTNDADQEAVRDLVLDEGPSAKKAKTDDEIEKIIRECSLLHKCAKKTEMIASNDAAALAVQLVAHLKSRAAKLTLRVGAPWPREDARKLIQDATNLMAKQESVVHINLCNKARLAIVGDLHGQFDDLCRILEMHGEPSEECQYLFNGDFVDRGANGVEVLLAIFSWKVAAPKWVHINRGNHEDDAINIGGGFRREVLAKYDLEMYYTFQTSFSKMPIGHIIQRTVLVVHGGLPRTMASIEDVAKVNREEDIIEPPGVMHDILWSDPCEGIDGFEPNLLRGGDGVVFGAKTTKTYLEANGLSLLVRSHQWKPVGWDVAHDGLCVTIFSATDYQGHRNGAAFLELSSQEAHKSSGFVLKHIGDLPNLGALVVRRIDDATASDSVRPSLRNPFALRNSSNVSFNTTTHQSLDVVEHALQTKDLHSNPEVVNQAQANTTNERADLFRLHCNEGHSK